MKCIIFSLFLISSLGAHAQFTNAQKTYITSAISTATAGMKTTITNQQTTISNLNNALVKFTADTLLKSRRIADLSARNSADSAADKKKIAALELANIELTRQLGLKDAAIKAIADTMNSVRYWTSQLNDSIYTNKHRDADRDLALRGLIADRSVLLNGTQHVIVDKVAWINIAVIAAQVKAYLEGKLP